MGKNKNRNIVKEDKNKQDVSEEQQQPDVLDQEQPNEFTSEEQQQPESNTQPDVSEEQQKKPVKPEYSKKENNIRLAMIKLNLIKKDSDRVVFLSTVSNFLLGLNVKNFINVEHHYDLLKMSLSIKLKQRKEILDKRKKVEQE